MNGVLIPSKKEIRGRKMSNDARTEMKIRISNGEFGDPEKPDMDAVNDAWQDIMESKMREMGNNGNFNTISGLWPKKGNKVAYDGRTKEDVFIPSGSKILCFYGNPEPGTRQPEFRLVYVSYDD